MRAVTAGVAIVVLVAVAAPPTHAQKATLQESQIAPSPSPSPADRDATRDRSPGFVALLLLLGAGLVWQLQRARRTTADVSARSLEDLERATRPSDDDGRGPGV